MHAADSGLVDSPRLEDVSDVAFIDELLAESGEHEVRPIPQTRRHPRPTRRYQQYLQPQAPRTRRAGRVDEAWASALRQAGIPVCPVCRLRNAPGVSHCECGVELVVRLAPRRSQRSAPEPVRSRRPRRALRLSLLSLALSALGGWACLQAFGHLL